MKTYFTRDLEWYQDNGGLIDYEKVFSNFQSIFNRDYDLKRNLIKESLEVHTIEGYGAIVRCSPFFRQENKVDIYSSLKAKK